MKDRTSLLLLSERYSPDLGGVARSATRTATALSRLGINVHVLAWTRSLQPGELQTTRPDDSAAPTLHRLGLFSNWDMSMQHSLNVLEWLHGTHAFDGTWGHYVYPAGFMAVMFAEMVGLPSTVSARGNDIDRLMFPPGDFARLTWTLDRASVVNAVSQDLMRKIDVLLGRPSNGVVVSNVVDADTFCPVSDGSSVAQQREELRLPKDDVILGFCGELRHKKGLPFVLQALAEGQSKRPTRLLVIGDVRPREQSTISSFLLDHPQLDDRITVTGHQDTPADVARYLRVCDIVLQPSVWDGLPNAVLEAMACERIVICSDAGGIPEAITHGETGFVIPKAQLHRLSEGIDEVLTMPSVDREAICRRARQSILNHFHPRVEAERLQLILSQLWPEEDLTSMKADS